MITQFQNEGPYILLGHSAGGNVAYEIAKELIARGYVVSDLIMIDSYYVENDDGKPIDAEERKQYTSQVVELFVESYPDLNTSSEKMRDYIGKKIENYFKFLTEIRITCQIDVNIHFIQSTGDIELKQSMRADMGKWAERTSREFIKYQGVGEHDNMLLTDYVKQNASLIRDILSK